MGENDKDAVSKEEYERLLAQNKELEELREKFLRSAADFDNARKRLSKEREEFVRFSQEKILGDLLPILDNFERALAHSEAGGKNRVEAGIRMIWKQLIEQLISHGLKRMQVEGELFDPRYHEAVDQVQEEGPEGVVTKELVPGYLLHDRVLRPAKVQIRTARAPQAKSHSARCPEEEKEEEIT
jgi:molecular chaperone GrpE